MYSCTGPRHGRPGIISHTFHLMEIRRPGCCASAVGKVREEALGLTLLDITLFTALPILGRKALLLLLLLTVQAEGKHQPTRRDAVRRGL